MTEYPPCKNSIDISMVDGAVSPIVGRGNVCILNLKLKSVLYVPGINYNLLSISRITKDMNCRVIFLPSYCIFQDQASGRTIGSAEAKDGLY